MDKKSEKMIISAIENFAYDNGYSFTDMYSGRFMYGATCVGITVPDPTTALTSLINYVVRATGFTFNEILNCLGANHFVDNMGMQYIIYFPKLDRKRKR